MGGKAYTYLAPLKKEISKCIKCGVCMAGCPTYAVTKDETMVARGRITLASAALNGRIGTSNKFEESITTCIGCLTCDVNCPSGVRIGDIMSAARAQIAETRGLNILEKIVSKIVRLRWPVPATFRFSSMLFKIYAWLPLRGPLRHILPFVKDNVKRKLPGAGSSPLSTQYPELIKTTNKMRAGTVAFFPGCVIDLSAQEMGISTISVLNKLGYDVALPKGQYCCGSPLHSLGDMKTAREVALKNIEIFSNLDVEAIIVSCATCGHMLKKEYPHLLSHALNGQFKKAEEFCEKIVDIHEFIYQNLPSQPGERGFSSETFMSQRLTKDENGEAKASPTLGRGDFSRPFSGERSRVTFHDPCHLKKGLGVYQQPRGVLRSIPSIEFVEMEEADACCGFGGIFSLYYYDLASQIGKNKAENIKRTGSQIVATGCPGCKIHIEDSLQRAGYPATVRHTVELLDEALK